MCMNAAALTDRLKIRKEKEPNADVYNVFDIFCLGHWNRSINTYARIRTTHTC